MSDLRLSHTTLGRMALSAVLVLLCPRSGWSQAVDLELVGISMVPTSSPGWYDVAPLMAGKVAQTLETIRVEYRVYVNGQGVASFPYVEVRYPVGGQCSPAGPPCLGTCMVDLLSPSMPLISVAGDCESLWGECWCSFPPTSLKPVRTRLGGCDLVTVVIDPLDKIAEVDESNNAVSVPAGVCGCGETETRPRIRKPRAVSGSLPRSSASSNLSEFPSKPKPIRAVKPMVYDWASQKVERHGTPQKRFASTFCYVDTDTVGFYTSTSLGIEFIDWGIMGGTATSKCCGLSDIVSNFTFAYGTATPDTSVAGPGASLTLTFYTGYKGFGEDSGNCPVATFAFTGMPGYSGASTGIGTSYAFAVDLSGGFEFCLPDGGFGWGYRGDGNTGPLLVQTGDGANGPEPCTGNINAFDIWVPDTKGVYVGTFSIHHIFEFSSWYGQIARADLSIPATLATRNVPPNKSGSLACSPAVLGGTLAFTVLTPGKSTAVLFAFDTPITLPLSGGQVLLCIDGGSGELLTGGGLFALPTGGSVGGCPELAASAAVPKNLAFCGLACSVQAVLFGPPPFALSNACDLTVGG